MLRIITSENSKPAASAVLRNLIKEISDAIGTLYFGFPVFGSPDGTQQIDALLVSSNYGLVSFDLHEENDLGEYIERQDNAANKIESRLREYRPLTKGRSLVLSIRTATIAANTSAPQDVDDDHPVFSDAQAAGTWIKETAETLDDTVFTALVSAIQNLGGLRSQVIPRKITKKESKGARLRLLEDKIATMDSSQDKAVLESFDSVQRIRGLAGSGKTVVLARKAALIHSRHPEWYIAITFETWSLKAQFERLIRQFLANQRLGEPNWEKLHIFSCWGSPQRPGLYSTYCRINNLPYRDVNSAKAQFRSSRALLHEVSKEARAAAGSPVPYYDAILVDEAQDLSREFLNLCYELLKAPKRLVYAYDELQSLDDSTMLSPEDTFGVNPDGTPKVKLRPDQDFILERCYRNSKPVLTTAHALGFGIYREKGLVQIFDDKDLWKDIGYRELSGNGIQDGEECILSRTDQTSPKFLEMDSPAEELICLKTFEDKEKQDEWVVASIKKNLREEDLMPNDILVINPDPFTTRENTGHIRAQLFSNGIKTILAGSDAGADVFFDGESIMLSGIRRARGNEASMVYIIAAHESFDAHTFELSQVRNRLFTAITRSKAWVCIVGWGKKMAALEKEIKKVFKEDFHLRFQYPDKEKRESLRLLNKDRTTEGRKLLKEIERALLDGEVDLEDLEQFRVAKRRRK